MRSRGVRVGSGSTGAIIGDSVASITSGGAGGSAGMTIETSNSIELGSGTLVSCGTNASAVATSPCPMMDNINTAGIATVSWRSGVECKWGCKFDFFSSPNACVWAGIGFTAQP